MLLQEGAVRAELETDSGHDKPFRGEERCITGEGGTCSHTEWEFGFIGFLGRTIFVQAVKMSCFIFYIYLLLVIQERL